MIDYRWNDCSHLFNAVTVIDLEWTHLRLIEIMLILRGFAHGVPTTNWTEGWDATASTC